jgi:hypothetical protein
MRCWPLLDTTHQVTIPSPATAETVVTTTRPSLELHLPAGVVITDEQKEMAFGNWFHAKASR